MTTLRPYVVVLGFLVSLGCRTVPRDLCAPQTGDDMPASRVAIAKRDTNSSPVVLRVRLEAANRPGEPLLKYGNILWRRVGDPAVSGLVVSDSVNAEYSSGPIAPGRYEVKIRRLGYQAYVDTVAVTPTLARVVYRLALGPRCLPATVPLSSD